MHHDEILYYGFLRYWLAKSSDLLTMINKIFIDEGSKFYQGTFEEKFHLENSKTGSFTGIQRFGSKLALDIHFHTVFTEGAFVENTEGTEGKAKFHNAPRPTDDDVALQLLKSLAEKTIVLLRRLGFLKEALEDGLSDMVLEMKMNELLFAENLVLL